MEKNSKNTKRKLIKRQSNKIQPVECSQVPQEHSEPEKNFPEIEQTSYAWFCLVWGPAPSQKGRVWSQAYIRVVKCSRNPATL